MDCEDDICQHFLTTFNDKSKEKAFKEMAKDSGNDEAKATQCS